MPVHAQATRSKPAAKRAPQVKRAGPGGRSAKAKQAAPAEWTFAPSLAQAGGVALQPALEVGPPGDEFEQEADRVAERIVTMPESAGAGSDAGGDGEELMRKPAEEPEEDAVQTALQRACAACAAGDDDRELQRAAAEDEELQRAAAEDEELQRACAGCEEEESPVQRQDDVFSKPPPVTEEDEEAKPAPAIQTKSARRRRPRNGPTPVPDRFKDELAHARRAGGETLPQPLRHFMEARFGASFERVRVHHDAAASELASSIRARAFTIGRHVFFRQGEFQPSTQQGQKLVAHELTHVLQQRGGLHSVQREIFERDRPAGESQEDAERKRAAETASFEELADFFGWREDALPPLVFEALRDLIERALHVQTFRESLAVFLLEGPADESVRRIVKSPAQRLRLELEQRGDTPQAATRWELEFLDGTRTPAAGGQPVTIGTDEDTVSVPGPTPEPRATPAAEAAPLAAAAPPPASTTSTAVSEPAGASAAKPAQPGSSKPAPATSGSGAEPAVAEGEATPAADASFPQSPEEDPNFRAVKQSAAGAAAATSEHSDGGELASNAKDAAAVKPGEQLSQAQANKADQMQAAKTPGFDKRAFVNAVLDKVRGTAPKTLQQANNYQRDHGAALSNTVNQAAATQTEATAAELAAVTKGAPNPSAVPARPAVPLDAEDVGARPRDIAAERAVVPEQPVSRVEGFVAANQQEAQKQLDELGYANAEKTFAESGDPDMLGTLESKQAFDADASAAPGAFREGEQALREGAAADAGALGDARLGAMFGARKELIGAVAQKQQGGKADSEKKRESVITEVNAIFTSTETKVKTRLGALKQTVFDTFRNESQRALDTFTSRVSSAERRWEEKGFFDRAADTIGSAILGIPTELEADLQAARDAFIAEMTRIVEAIAATVERELTAAKYDIAGGRAELARFLDGLDPSLDALREELSVEFQGKFTALEGEVKSAESSLVSGLAEQFKARLAESDQLLNDVRDRNRGFFDVLADGIKVVREKTIGLIEKLQQVFQDGTETLMKVLDDPKTFAKNFLSGIQQGVENFATNILTHLKAGLIEWLTGTVQGAGITLPESFDVKGIVGFILQLLGLTIENVKARARVIWGERVVRAIELGVEGVKKAIELFGILETQGVAGLFDYLASKFSELQAMALDKIKEAVSLELVKAAVKKLATLLVPGGALLQAVLSIIDAVFFFINNAGRLADLVQTITNAVKDILAGNVGALAAKVEATLARTIPIVLDFLATLIGIGGKITDIIRDALAAIRAPVTEAIDAVLLAIKSAVVGLVDRIMGKGDGAPGGKAGEDKKLAEQPPPEPGTPMTEKQIIAAVVPKLAQPTLATDPAEALAEKKAQAEALKQQFQPSAPEGKTLKITFSDKSGEDVAKDHEVDMEVGFSPGTPAKAPVGDDFWPKGLEPRTNFPSLVELDAREKEQGIPADARSPARYLKDFNTQYLGEQSLERYINGRAARKLGRLAEGPALAEYSKLSGISGMAKVALVVEREDGSRIDRIPDLFKRAVVVGDVKNVKEASFDEQLRDDRRIKDGKSFLADGTPAGPTTHFHLLVRKVTEAHPEGTKVSGPLRRALTAAPFEVVE